MQLMPAGRKSRQAGPQLKSNRALATTDFGHDRMSPQPYRAATASVHVDGKRAATETTFDITAFGAGSPEGQQLCLQNVTVPDGNTFLDAVHMQIIHKMLASALPADASFDFSAALYAPGTGCTGAPLPEAGATPVTMVLPFVKK